MKEFQFSISPKLKNKFDLLIKQLVVKDVWILIDGDEGSGKTNMASYILYYFHCMTGRPFDVNNFYFDADKLREKAQSSTGQLLAWDEATLGGMSTEWWNNAQQDLLKFARTGRIKHHVFVMCIPKFDKLNETLRLERSHALINVHCGKDNTRYGHYNYLTRRGKEALNRLWKKKHIRLYPKFAQRGGHRGWIPYVFNKVFTEEEQKIYEKNKLDAINSIGKKKLSRANKEMKEIKHKVGLLKCPIKTREELAEKVGVNIRTLQKWALDDFLSKENEDDDDLANIYINNKSSDEDGHAVKKEDEYTKVESGIPEDNETN